MTFDNERRFTVKRTSAETRTTRHDTRKQQIDDKPTRKHQYTTSKTAAMSKEGGEGEGSLLRQTLMNVDECFVYKIPPMATSGGHRWVYFLCDCCFTLGKNQETYAHLLSILITERNIGTWLIHSKPADSKSNDATMICTYCLPRTITPNSLRWPKYTKKLANRSKLW